MHINNGGGEHALVNGWLQRIGSQTGLTLQLDKDGVCAIGHASDLDCAIEVPDGRGAVYLRVPLMPWHKGPHPDLAEYCLCEHFLGINTKGACFAIDPIERDLVLWMVQPLAGLNEESFAALIVDFLESAAAWKEKLTAFNHRATEAVTNAVEEEILDSFGKRA